MFFLIPTGFATDCPFGLVNEPYPGTCARYTDFNSDHICDLSQEPIKTVTTTQPITIKPRYEFAGLSLAMILIYLATFLLYKTNKITVVTHRKIWNILLLITFLISAILGILLVIRINYGILFDFLPFNMLYWHVEAGIAMTIISLFHISWHWKYYISMIRKDLGKHIVKKKKSK